MPKKRKCIECGSTQKPHHKCVKCGRWFCKKHIEYASDPFASDIHDDHTKVWECEECRYESARAI